MQVNVLPVAGQGRKGRVAVVKRVGQGEASVHGGPLQLVHGRGVPVVELRVPAGVERAPAAVVKPGLDGAALYFLDGAEGAVFHVHPGVAPQEDDPVAGAKVQLALDGGKGLFLARQQAQLLEDFPAFPVERLDVRVAVGGHDA